MPRFPPLFYELAEANYCPQIGEIATRLGLPTDTVIAVIVRLRDEGKLWGIVYDSPEGNHDLAPEDLPTLLEALSPKETE